MAVTASWVKRHVATLVVFLSLVFFHEPSLACAVCFDGKNDETRLAFILMTFFLTMLPLSLIGFFIWWVRAKWREAEQELAVTDDRPEEVY